ncbi:protein of unknown function [Tenacibaculum sp. 190524A02b]|uniref:pentapeptide repeat-containing protein n=1 Tax=Tenacibaculum vairaonense TaxID=3137860 RepID=UPI0032B107A5
MPKKKITKEELEKIIKEHQLWIVSGLKKGARAGLTEVDLSGSNLSQTILIGAFLSGANLRGANLSGADLKVTDLSAANLNGANLVRSDLRDAILSKVDLNGADLTGANLSGTDITGADLGNAELIDADLTGADLRDVDLRYADLTGTNLTGANLIGVDLRYANLKEANLTGVNLTGADLGNAELRHADLTEANLIEANLKGVNILETVLENVIFYKSDENNNNIQVNVAIYDEEIPLVNQEEIVNSIGDLMKAMGFKYKEKNEPVFGSFFQDLFFEFVKPIASKLSPLLFERVRKIFNKDKESLRDSKNIDIVKAYSMVVKSLESIDNAVIRIGELILIKKTINGKSVLISETISKSIANDLDSNPELLSSQDKIIGYLENKGVIIPELKDLEKKAV